MTSKSLELRPELCNYSRIKNKVIDGKVDTKSFNGKKEIVIDFLCKSELTLNTLRELLEVIMMS